MVKPIIKERSPRNIKPELYKVISYKSSYSFIVCRCHFSEFQHFYILYRRSYDQFRTAWYQDPLTCHVLLFEIIPRKQLSFSLDHRVNIR